jgi:hypothetical protein
MEAGKGKEKIAIQNLKKINLKKDIINQIKSE